MSVLLFKLKNVPDDEAEAIRQLLSEHEISFYETTAGNWGASMPAIWLKESDNEIYARQLIDTWQAEHYRKARERFLQQKHIGENRTLLSAFIQEPLRMLFYFSAIIFILYLSFRLVYDLIA